MDYIDLTPEEKIEQYLKDRQKDLKLNKYKPIILYVFFFIITSISTFIAFGEYNWYFVLLAPLVFTIGFLSSRPNWKNKTAEFMYENTYHEPLNIATEEQIKQNLSSSTNLRIINTICVGKNYKGELLFGKESQKVLFPIKAYSTRMKYFIEEGIRKNEPCFIICINSFENPVAVFSGRYTGTKYLTFDEK